MKKVLLATVLLMAADVTAKSASPGTADNLKPSLPAVKINGTINLSGKMDDQL
jgi:hypothetical protein